MATNMQQPAFMQKLAVIQEQAAKVEASINAQGALNTLSKEEKKALLEKMLQRKLQNSVQSAPMSKGQESLWFVHQHAPDTCAYNVASAIRIFTPVDVDLFQRALNTLVQRHAALRTCYVTNAADNQQVIHASAALDIIRCDASSLDDAQLQARITADYEQPFNLHQLPVVRAHLYELAQGQQVFMLVVHHIAFDAWSLWVLMEELSESYQSLVAGRPLNLAPQAATYKSYAQAQAQLLQGKRGEQLKKYWLEKLQGDIHPLSLHISKPRPSVQTFEGASHYFQLSPELSQSLNLAAKLQGVTPFTLLLSSYYVLLHRHSSQDDICVVSPTSGRQQSEFLRTVGYFVNPVVLRAQLNGNPRFSDLVSQVNETVLEALEHQDYPFSSLIEALNPTRDPSYTPLSQASFVFQKPQQDEGLNSAWVPGQQGPKIQWAGLEIAQYPLNQQEGQFELELEVVDTKGRFYGIFKYNRNLFSASDMVTLENHLLQLLQGLVANPDDGIKQLPMLTPAEVHQQFSVWNNTEVDYHSYASLHELIEQQVSKTPDAIAVAFEGEQLTYAEINSRANKLAHFLIAQGITRDTKVGVCMNRSVEMVVALLGIVKAGGAYVPIDPNYPRARVEFMLGDINSRILLTQSAVAKDLPPTTSTVVCVDILDLQGFSDQNPDVVVAPDDLAYMIYTSGSTGNPKGAMNTHAAICNRLLWMQAEYKLDGSDSVLQKTPFSFDVSVWEFFWPLMTGARLVVAKPDGHKDTQYLVDIIKAEQITTLHFVPSMLSIFVADAKSSECTSIKRVICSGEALSYDLQKRFFNRLDTELHNLYGPTEAAIDVTYWHCSNNYAANVVPIGKPIANIQIHVLDEFMQPVPVGVPGELHIGGIGLARGYHNREDLTNAKFIKDPFSADPAARLYKTGDLVRYLPDGNIDYLQRMDNQVKLRGFRIELGEVEAMVCSCAGVREAVVLKSSRAQGDDYLVAYVTLDDETATEQSILIEAAGKMPVHCVPSAVVMMDSIPLTPNGKADIKALPAHSFGGKAARNAVPPRSELERKLIKLWADVLKIDHLGITDNFFALGGHSLLAVRLIASVEAELGQKLPLSSLIKNPTIAELALLIETAPGDAWSSLIPIREQGNKAPLFFIPGGGGNVLYYYALAEQLGGDQPFYAMQAIGLDGVTPPLDSVQKMAAATIAEIKAVRPQGPYLIGGHCVGSLIAFEITQQLLAAGDQVERLFVLDAPAPHFFAEKKSIALTSAEWVGVLTSTIAHMTGIELALDPQALAAADQAQQLELLKQKMAQANMVPGNAPISQIKGLLDVFVANAQLHYEVNPQVHPVNISLFRARDFNPHYDYSCYDDIDSELDSSSLGWNKYVRSLVNIHLVDGDHITMLATENAERLAEHLSQSGSL